MKKKYGKVTAQIDNKFLGKSYSEEMYRYDLY